MYFFKPNSTSTLLRFREMQTYYYYLFIFIVMYNSAARLRFEFEPNKSILYDIVDCHVHLFRHINQRRKILK